jgi:L-threonylcarbamoyladenylate synthase
VPEPSHPSPVVRVADPTALDQAAAALRAGGAVVLPTDTVYGVAALPSVAGATAQLFALKDRSDGQPLAVLVADVNQAAGLAAPVTRPVAAWMMDHWPGPLTLVLSRSESARRVELGGSAQTVGIRCPDDRFVRALARRVGPIATTSANRHGQPTPATALEAAGSLTAPVALVIDGGPCGGVPSTVIDASTTPARVLRAGALDPAALGLAPPD